MFFRGRTRLVVALAAAVLGCTGDPPADSPDPGGDTAEVVDTADSALTILDTATGDYCLAWPDADGDGYVLSFAQCWYRWQGPIPAGYTDPPCSIYADEWTDCGDCDDVDPTAYYGAPEVCYDGIDQDCWGDSYEYDCDMDRHDAAEFGGDDCADDNAAAAPGFREWCGDGVDGDCDGTVDDEPCSAAALLDEGVRVLGGEGDAGVGTTVHFYASEPGVVGMAVGYRTAEDYRTAIIDRFVAGDRTPDEAATAIIHEGIVEASGLDYTGDGVEDLPVLWWPEARLGIMAGPIEGDRAESDAAWIMDASAAHAVGDMTGDGVPDLWVYAVDSGVFAGPFTETAATTPYAWFGWGQGTEGFGAGDVDGDGFNDIVVDRTDRGGPSLVLGPIAGEVPSSDIAFTLPDAWWACGIGDADGDGRDDIISGTAPDAGFTLSMDPVGSAAATATIAFDGSAYAGTVHPLGDLNGDGRGEIGLEYGGLLLLRGPYEGSIDAMEVGTWLTLASGELRWWEDVATGRDVDGDGVFDFAVGLSGLEAGAGVGAVLFESGAEFAE